jgi:hypothetical protein
MNKTVLVALGRPAILAGSGAGLCSGRLAGAALSAGHGHGGGGQWAALIVNGLNPPNYHDWAG